MAIATGIWLKYRWFLIDFFISENISCNRVATVLRNVIHAYLLRSCFVMSFTLLLRFRLPVQFSSSRVSSVARLAAEFFMHLFWIASHASRPRYDPLRRRVASRVPRTRARMTRGKTRSRIFRWCPFNKIARHPSFIANDDINNGEVWCKWSWKVHQTPPINHIMNADSVMSSEMCLEWRVSHLESFYFLFRTDKLLWIIYK